MKKLVVLLSMVATVSAFSQGQVNFVTYSTTPGAAVNAKVSYGSGGPVTAGIFPTSTNSSYASGSQIFGGINARAALYAIAGNTGTRDQLSIITPSVPFYNLNALAGYVNATANGGSKSRDVPGTTAGQGQGTFQIRAWDCGVAPADNNMSYEDAVTYIGQGHQGYLGEGNVFSVNLGGGSVAATALSPATAFTLNYVPEPSVIGLGILGALAGLFVFRRRN